jgi:N-acetyl-anhydromuramyl-L-alanine amidase AmpD
MSGLMWLPGKLIVDTVYALSVPNLLQMKPLGDPWSVSRGGRAIDEVILHGTESQGSEQQSAKYLSTKNGEKSSIHYFIGRTQGVVYAIVPEAQGANHSGLKPNPDKPYPSSIVSHNTRSIGIEMYQMDISVFKGDKSKLDFTDWQYETVAQLCYDICHRNTIARTSILAHGTINSQDRADPKGFDWKRFNTRIDAISAEIAGKLGAGFALA